jgi:glutamate-5-semialdehyde dehydrogenase
VRSPDREGARALVSLPALLPLVILRGSGETTAALARHAAEHGVRTLAHAEGGGVLYLAASADPAVAETMIDASLDRVGVCNRLNLLLVDRAAAAALLPPIAAQLERLGIELRGTEQARSYAAMAPLDLRLGHEWANDADRVATVSVGVVDGPDEAARLANEETSALAATIVAADETVAQRFLDRYRGTAAFWQAPTRFTDGFALTGAPETGINVDWVPGPRGPVTYRDLWLRQYRVVGDGTQRR